MHKMQSGGWPYSKLVETPRSSKVPSLRPAVLRADAFHSNILRSDRNR